MKKRTQEIKNLICQLSGTLIGIGLEEKELISAIQKNDNIIDCKLLNSIEFEQNEKVKFKKRKKYVAIRKIRKKFKKKKHDYMLINYSHIAFYLKTIIKDSIYVTKKTIFLYNVPKEDLELLKRRYQRYTVTIEEQGAIIKIDVQNAKNHILLDFCYFIGDTFYNLIELLSEFLIN